MRSSFVVAVSLALGGVHATKLLDRNLAYGSPFIDITDVSPLYSESMRELTLDFSSPMILAQLKRVICNMQKDS